MTRARRRAALTALVAATLLAACGSSGSSSSATSGPTTAASAPATSGGATPAAGADAVTIKGFAFNPADLTVKAGDKVTWTNEDSATHKIKSADGSFDSDGLSQSDTFDHVFATAGTFAYICSIHPSMKGTITVTA